MLIKTHFISVKYIIDGTSTNIYLNKAVTDSSGNIYVSASTWTGNLAITNTTPATSTTTATATATATGVAAAIALASRAPVVGTTSQPHLPNPPKCGRWTVDCLAAAL